MRYLIVLMTLVMLMIGCSEDCPTCPTDVDTVYVPVDTTVTPEWIEPTLNLQSIDVSLAKSLIEQYPEGVPYHEIETLMLSKAANGGTIEFGDVNSTKEFFYILVNHGSADIRNVQFNTEMVVADPGYISVVQSNGVGIGLISILKVAVPHLVSLDGTGQPLPFEIGDFVDTVHTTYEYTSLQGDTVNADQDWEVTGTKMGASFDVQIDGETLFGDNLREIQIFTNESDNETVYSMFTGGISDVDAVEPVLVNTGNVDLAVAIYAYPDPWQVTQGPIHTQTVWVGSEFPLGDYTTTSDGEFAQVNFMKVYSLETAINFYETTYLGGTVELLVYYDEN